MTDCGELDPHSRAPPLLGCGYLGAEPRARPDWSARPRPRRRDQNAQPSAAHVRAPPQPRQVIPACAPRMPDVARGPGATSLPASPPACPLSPGPGGGGVSPACPRSQQPALRPCPRRTQSPIPAASGARGAQVGRAGRAARKLARAATWPPSEHAQCSPRAAPAGPAVAATGPRAGRGTRDRGGLGASPWDAATGLRGPPAALPQISESPGSRTQAFVPLAFIEHLLCVWLSGIACLGMARAWRSTSLK